MDATDVAAVDTDNAADDGEDAEDEEDEEVALALALELLFGGGGVSSAEEVEPRPPLASWSFRHSAPPSDRTTEAEI